jgi:hypothetical protein
MSILELLIVVLVIAWLLGLVALPAAGNLIHLLLLVVVVLVIVRLAQGRKVL